MANTFLNTNRTGMATSNVQANIAQTNNQTQEAVQNNVSGTNGVVQQTQPTQPNQGSQVNPITIPIQIQPQIAPTGQPQTTSNAQPNSNLQTYNNTASSVQSNNAPTPQTYQNTNTSNNIVDFNQIYSSYQSVYGTNSSADATGTSGIKKTSIGTTIVTPTTSNLNSVEGMYQSAYSDTINSLISTLIQNLETGFQYDPTTDTALQVAAEYAANSTLSALAGSGVLNSSATAERVARVVSELIPQYEQLAYTRWSDYIGQLSSTAQLVMNYDSQQFEYWKDAKDREFKEKEFAYQKQQDALENAWKRVDELGYVDNQASAILGVAVGTLSGEARLAKEQREFELAKMREQAQIEYQNNVALYKLKSELDTSQSKALAEYEYTLAQKYGTSKSSSNTTSLSTYQDIINNRWADYDDFTRKYTVTDNDGLYNYLTSEYASGRLSQNDLAALSAMYGVTTPQSNTSKTIESAKNSINKIYNNALSALGIGR